MSSKVLVVMSGGLDSTTLAYDLQQQGWDVSAVSFNYGQRHGERELAMARLHAEEQNWDHSIIDISMMQESLKSALTGAEDVPDGHYAEQSMKATIVPNRNAIMMSLACGIAVAKDIDFIATAVHGGDHFIYPDCRPEFIEALNDAFMVGNEGFFGILAPYVRKDKNFIAQRAMDLYDYTKTWSCYKGGEKHCGKCGTCVERMEAIWSAITPGGESGSRDENVPLANRLDFFFPSDLYEDNRFWMEALKKGAN